MKQGDAIVILPAAIGAGVTIYAGPVYFMALAAFSGLFVAIAWGFEKISKKKQK